MLDDVLYPGIPMAEWQTLFSEQVSLNFILIGR